MSISDRRHAVARAHALRALGMSVTQIAKALCVMHEVVEIWLTEEPTEGT
jgi:transposase